MKLFNSGDMKEKGVEDAIEAIETINKEAGKDIYILEIYGHVDEGYVARFEEILQTFTKAIQYKGMIQYDKSAEAIKDYYALLFSTCWKREGFPGTIVNAFSAGLPVIATDLNCNSEIVTNKANGILYPNEDIMNLKDAIEYLIKDTENIQTMKMNCISTAKKYQPDIYVDVIVNRIVNSK